MKTTKFKDVAIEDSGKPESTPKTIVTEAVHRTSTDGSPAHKSPYKRMMLELEKVLDTRNKLKVYDTIGDQMVDVTPKLLNIPEEKDKLFELTSRYSSLPVGDFDMLSFRSYPSTILRHRPSRAISMHPSLEDVIDGIGIDRIVLDAPTRDSTFSWRTENLDSPTFSASFEDGPVTTKWHKPFVRIILRKTQLILLYEQQSTTAIKATAEGNLVEMDNSEYDFLTIGRGKVRRRSESEAQTAPTLYTSRKINTEEFETSDASCFVSNYEMYDTLQILDDFPSEEAPKKSYISERKTPDEEFNLIAQLPSFHLASVVMKRLLAGNTFEEGQRRFRNMSEANRAKDKVNYKYSVNTLFTIYPKDKDSERKAVADMSFCCVNSDILAVGYGIFSYQAAKLPSTGEVCIWSIKNPCDPERFYSYSVPVVSVEFSPFIPMLLAIGLFDGSVEVRDITEVNQPPLAITNRTLNPGVDAILSIKWIKDSTASEEIDPFIALSQDGSVTQYRIIRSPYLAGFKIMTLKRLEGLPEGLPGIIPSTETVTKASGSPQGLSLAKHPTQLDIYYILTDEGCLHKCSTNYQQHYIQALRTHEGSVNHMDFSPWSPRLFLTCGNDWCLRIWMVGIFEPLITLKNVCQPYNWAAWSRTHSTILVAINRTHCEVWDLGRNILKPISTTEFNSSYNTMGIFSLDGNSLLIGKERGQVLVNALDDMPFPPHYQYEFLEKAIYKAVGNHPDLFVELKSMGYFGYPNKDFLKST